MAQIDAGEPTVTELILERLEVLRIARAELDKHEWGTEIDVYDVVSVAEFLMGKDAG